MRHPSILAGTPPAAPAVRAPLVRCPVCPGRPSLAAPAGTDVRRCIRCQADRPLPVPHPGDHLCPICRSECPGCGAPAGPGRSGTCRACQGRCRRCAGPLPDRGGEPITLETPARRENEQPRYRFIGRTARELCDACRDDPGDAEQLVLDAFPAPLLRACQGTVPRRVVDLVRAELARGTAGTRLVERVERRWWLRWANLPLARPATEDTDRYGPDDVALWLVAPGGCRAGCEDGWVPSDPDQPCPVCRPPIPHRAVAVGPPSAVAADMAATARAALRANKPGRRQRAAYVPAAASSGDEQDRERLRRLAAQPRVRPATQRHPEISPIEAAADPGWAAAVRRARAERGSGRPS